MVKVMLRRLFIMANISNSRTVGVIKLFAGDTPPEGHLVCNGAAVSRAAYPELFAAIGTRYGAGDILAGKLDTSPAQFVISLDNARVAAGDTEMTPHRTCGAHIGKRGKGGGATKPRNGQTGGGVMELTEIAGIM